MEYLTHPLSIITLVSFAGLGVYGGLVRKSVIDPSNKKQLEIELSSLITVGSIVIMIGSFFTGTASDAGQTSIKLKFILTILFIHLISLTRPLLDVVWPEWHNIHKHSVQNLVKSVILLLTVAFLVGSPDNMDEWGIKLQFILFVAIFEVLITMGSVWFGSSVISIPNFSQEHNFSEVENIEPAFLPF